MMDIDFNIVKMFKIISMIDADLQKFLEVQLRVKAVKGNTTGGKRPALPETDEKDLDGIHVDINKNFNMLTAFGSFSIVELMENYIFE